MRIQAILFALILGHLPLSADISLLEPSRLKAKLAVTLKAQPFDLKDVRLLDGPFKHAMELDHRYLLNLDPDRLLHTFRINAGLPSSAPPLGGWEEPKGEVRGHSLGHYLTASALMYASTGDEKLKQKTRYVVAELAKCQDALKSGYLSAYPEEFFDRVESRKRVWAPYYTLHKIYAGLLDVYVHCDNPQGLAVSRKFADWVIARNAKLTDAHMQQMLETEHGGMNEVLANLYALTGEKKYLDISLRFNHQAVIAPAAKREDRLTGLHANTQIPKFVGTARQYELAGDEALRTASFFFWHTVVNERSYVIGGHSDGEAFSPKERLSHALGPNTTETCNTYNMLKLTRHIFCWEPTVAAADYYERALYNHILASQNPETGMMCYYVPLRSGSQKRYNTPNHSFWCCTGTGIENHAKYGDSIYFHDGGSTLWVNLFIASELTWKAKGLTLRQETRFPDEESSRLTITTKSPIDLSLRIRRPGWTTVGFTVRVNGKKQTTTAEAGSYVTITRTWKSGDTVDMIMPFGLRTEGFRDNPQRLAFLNGPLVLCAEVPPGKYYPAIVGAIKGIVPTRGKPSTYTVPAKLFRTPGQKSSAGVTLEPFFRMHGNRHYMVYWDSFTPQQWEVKQEEYKVELARQRELDARTVDHVTPGYPQNERDHQLQGERTGAGDFQGRKWRHASDGGWFSYQLKVLDGTPQELSATYWGSDGGNRIFDILVDGTKLATQRLQNNKAGELYRETYALPETLTRGKARITVRLQAHPGATAGGIFGLRVLKK